MIKPYICVVWTECPGELSISRPLSLGARWCRRQWAVSFAVGGLTPGDVYGVTEWICILIVLVVQHYTFATELTISQRVNFTVCK